jgi:para-nitrobenzyl esterase
MTRTLTAICLMAFAASVAAQSTAVHRSYDTAFLGPILPDPVLQHAKETFVLFGCAYCHGLDLVSRGEATDLMHSALVGRDENGNRIGPLLRMGIPQTAKLSPMPQFSDLSDRQINALVTWIHYARQQGRYKELTAMPVKAGDAAAGKTYFDRSCTSCHKADGDLSSVVRAGDAAALRAAMLDPKGLKRDRSFTLERRNDKVFADAQQRHHAFVENVSADDVANLLAYLRGGRSSAANQPTVNTTRGAVAGTHGRNETIAVFRGVPYAAPPIGDRRWAAPAPIPPWSATRDATRFGANCPQNIVTERKPWTHEFMAHGETSEDCLYLNVWTAGLGAAQKRPVYVYLHGGGFNEGSGSVAVYDGEGLARKGLVVVTVNYRLGVLGFLAHPELTRESPHHASGNYGLLDQIAALQWVRDNIAAFGGDPSRVTVAGQSAGGMSVIALIGSPLAKGLFHRAIIESGLLNPARERSLHDAETDGVQFAADKGAASLAALRAMPADQFVGRSMFRPIVDGYLLPESMDTLVAKRRINDVPIMIGFNADEGGATPESDAATNQKARDQQRAGIVQWVTAFEGAAGSKVFVYMWSHALPGPDVTKFGAFHTSEVPYAMNTLDMSDRPFTKVDRRVGDAVSSYFANFAKTGDPNGDGVAGWASYSSAVPKVFELGDALGSE